MLEIVFLFYVLCIFSVFMISYVNDMSETLFNRENICLNIWFINKYYNSNILHYTM